MGTDDNLLDDLEDRWLEAAEAGRQLAAGELCADRPDLLSALEERLIPLRQVHRLLRGASAVQETVSAVGANSHPSNVSLTQTYNSNSADPIADDRAFIIGRYRVDRLLGKGSFGRVFLGYDGLLQRFVAIKVPHRRLVSRPEQAAAYLTEAQLVASLDHPNIVPVFDVGSTKEWPCFVVSKFIDGSDLATRLKRTPPLPILEAINLVAGVADALHYAHTRGLVHRDVKPGNILLDGGGRPYAADFGLALREQDVGTGPRFAGTPAYMSPEQARGEGHRVDGRSDVFSLGVVLYELLTSRRPFGAETEDELREQIAQTEPRPPRQVNERIPPAIERICLKAISKRATDRYPTAKDMADDLRHAADPLQPAPAFGPIVADSVKPAAAEAPSAPVVPKGLRSFDAGDADFFLDLIPGPRDRNGLPDMIRFWKSRIEEIDGDQTFSVGLLYGPSGCGKSSFVKAGLLPRLAAHVRTIYLEATHDLQARLRQRLVRRHPRLRECRGLGQVLARIRRGDSGREGEKTLIVVDQFEQWLHAHPSGEDVELTRALRQCDGARLQCLLLVRDDYWGPASRFMRELESPVSDGQNAAAVDLFTPAHAHKVLTAFGQAYGTLPGPDQHLRAEQTAFLDRAVGELTEGGWVIPVQLALFADMLRHRDWTLATLRAVGGATGVGVAFLEENFASATAPPEQRVHGEAVRDVLAALVPEPGTDIRGHVRSRSDLLEKSGYQRTPDRFDDLVRVLAGNTRLLTPVAKESADSTIGPATASVPEEGSFQLTHDYMVPSIREWLARGQQQTRRGRAELKLGERTCLWQAKPERRQLPSLFEWLSIRMYTHRRLWNAAQRRMMHAAARRHLMLVSQGVLLIALFMAVGFAVRGRIVREQASVQADGLVRRLLDANVTETPKVIGEMDGYREWVDPILQKELAASGARPERRLRARLALLPIDPGQIEPLRDALLDANPDEFLVIRDALTPHSDVLIAGLWEQLESTNGDARRRFRAAGALAAFDPADLRWKTHASWVTGHLVAQPSLLLPRWVEALRPVKDLLSPALADLIRARPAAASSTVVAEILADYAADQPEVLAEALGNAKQDQFAIFFARLESRPAEAITVLNAAFDRARIADVPPNEKASREANLAIALLRLGNADRVWPMLKSSPDPRARSFAIDRFATLGCAPTAFLARLNDESDPSTRAALWLGLGGFDQRAIPPERRAEILPRILAAYRQDPNASVHAAAWWLLGQWGARPADPLVVGSVPDREWSVNSIGQTLVRIAGPVEFKMGAPPNELGTVQDIEKQRTVRIEKSYEIGMTKVTVGQYRLFLEAQRRLDGNAPSPEQPVPDPEVPITKLTWYEAAAFCNWLSASEGLPASEWCYQPNKDGKYAQGMTVVAQYRGKKGYRLPTSGEWEYACRGGATTSRCYGDDNELLPSYAWFVLNALDGPAAVARLRPNAFGLFDVHGNGPEWCQNQFSQTAEQQAGNVDVETVLDKDYREVRGGKPTSNAASIRSAKRYSDRPTIMDGGGFRVVRGAP